MKIQWIKLTVIYLPSLGQLAQPVHPQWFKKRYMMNTTQHTLLATKEHERQQGCCVEATQES